MEKIQNDIMGNDGEVEPIEAQAIEDIIESGEIEIEKAEKNPENDVENPPKKKRGRPRKEDVEARKKEQARQYLEGINLIIPDPYKLTASEIDALVETGADRVIKWLGGARNSDAAFWLTIYGIIDARLNITKKLLKILKNKVENMKNEGNIGNW